MVKLVNSRVQFFAL